MTEKTKIHSIKLVVQEAFGDYRRGDEITDKKIIDDVLATHADHVVKVYTRES